MTDDPIRQSILDNEHLKLLSFFYWVSSGLSAFYSLIGLIYGIFGVAMFEMMSKMPKSADPRNDPPPALFGWVFGGIGFAIFLFFICLAILKLRAGFCIKARKSRTLCLVAAAFACLEIPYGTILGVFTFIVLERASVRAEFADPTAP
jgi:hypothetical protein